ncbi:hypothetical protein L249_3971 [Ophiocordyceps polyrhachis-furcata BCC 54312]|uniref:Uncharacterized protein n=1 Tax=Ophiocordyceps polyrhachis-furcata BCC 54312 TaxID=1330021 RepID=A0A367L5M0_9HYPO|nr:hypothetical protein L249_3971 [Ophiocordyceps polyrhachis-furcata BCC 54312]
MLSSSYWQHASTHDREEAAVIGKSPRPAFLIIRGRGCRCLMLPAASRRIASPAARREADGRRDTDSADLLQEIERLKRMNQYLQQIVSDLEGKPLPDDEIEKRFESVYDAMQVWITNIEYDYAIQHLDFQRLLYDVFERGTESGFLHKLGLRNNEDDLLWSGKHAAYERMEWLKRHSSCIQVVLFRLLWWSLYNSVFNKSYPLGMVREVERGLDLAWNQIGDESNDSISRAMTCKAFTMNAFTATTSFNENKKQKMNKFLVKTCESILSQVPIQSSIWKKHLPYLEESVVRPAVELKQALTCSSIGYQIREPKELLLRQCDLRDAKIRRCKLMDASTLSEFKPSCGAVFVMACACPGIYKGSEDEEGVSIVEPVLIVCEKDPALAPRRAPRSLSLKARYRDVPDPSVEPRSPEARRLGWSYSFPRWAMPKVLLTLSDGYPNRARVAKGRLGSKAGGVPEAGPASTFPYHENEDDDRLLQRPNAYDDVGMDMRDWEYRGSEANGVRAPEGRIVIHL